jgi:putative membrane protein
MVGNGMGNVAHSASCNSCNLFFCKNYSQNKNGQNNESPMETLKKRYAKGEITKEQFEEMKKNIS